MSRDHGPWRRLAELGRFEFWGIFFTLLALAQLAAELYLASFGPPGAGYLWSWSITDVAYFVRHAPVLLFFPLVPLLMALIPTWTFLALTNGPVSARRISGRLLAIALIALGVAVAASWPASDVRRAGFERAAKRMAPLVAAIRRFDAEVGRPPYDLAELTPRYLATVYQFGVRGCRSLKYSYAPADAAGRWALRLDCPNGMLTLDQFFFWPSGDYPTWNSVERLGEWAYFWD